MESGSNNDRDTVISSPDFSTTAMRLEDMVRDVFYRSGYEIAPARDRKMPVDFEAASESSTKYLITIKASTTLHYKKPSYLLRTLQLLKDSADVKNRRAIPVLVLLAEMDDRCAQAIQKADMDSLIVLDVSNILHATRGSSLWKDFVGALPYSISGMELRESELPLGWLEHNAPIESLLKRLDGCPPGKKGWMEFEDICCNALKCIFTDELTLWKRQERSNSELYRFDLICRIKDDVRDSAWRLFATYFNSKYVVFEFKNYETRVTQKEIYSTEKYLYRKALRSVAIIISRNGYDTHAIGAAKGCLREAGKLILLLTERDIKDMLNLMIEEQDPSGYLLDKVDELLIDLEK